MTITTKYAIGDIVALRSSPVGGPEGHQPFVITGVCLCEPLKEVHYFLSELSDDGESFPIRNGVSESEIWLEASV